MGKPGKPTKRELSSQGREQSFWGLVFLGCFHDSCFFFSFFGGFAFVAGEKIDAQAACAKRPGHLMFCLSTSFLQSAFLMFGFAKYFCPNTTGFGLFSFHCVFFVFLEGWYLIFEQGPEPYKNTGRP